MRLLKGILSKRARPLAEERGTVAIEFAIIVPVMLLAYLGSIQLSQAIAVNRLTSLTLDTVVNLVSQYQTISASQTMPDIFNAAATVLTPYPAKNAHITVTCITTDANGHATVAWSQAYNGAARTAGQAISIPPTLDYPNMSFVLGEISYAYTPTIDYLKLGTINLASSLYMLPRNSSTITLGP